MYDEHREIYWFFIRLSSVLNTCLPPCTHKKRASIACSMTHDPVICKKLTFICINSILLRVQEGVSDVIWNKSLSLTGKQQLDGLTATTF